MTNQDLFIQGKTHDLGGFSVSRILPHIKKRSIGPFVFIDHMGPMKIDQTHLLDVRPHPHIGLATVTYLLEGRGFHRDSIGSQQIIYPGDINLMVAGRGIVHSERTPEEDRSDFNNKTIHGLQIWLALPLSDERCQPEFHNYPKEKIPRLDLDQKIQTELLIGCWQDLKSPVKTFSSTLLMILRARNSVRRQMSFQEAEIGVLLVSGHAQVNGISLNVNDFVVVENPRSVELQIEVGAVVAVLGGAPLAEPRFMWWNLVSSKKEWIREAAEKWKNQEMGRVEGETDFIPLPSQPLP